MKSALQILAAGALLLAACQSAAPAAGVAPALSMGETPAMASPIPAIPTLSPRADTPAEPATSASPTAAGSSVAPASAEPPAAASPAALAPPAQPGSPALLDGGCTPDRCAYAGTLILQPPILPPGNDVFDLTYRFGSTQSGTHDPHHGVEFLNAFGTPVVAAAAGKVVVAGSDSDPTSERGVWPPSFYGPYSNFYGALVVIEHPAPTVAPQPEAGLPLPLYTLYGHLSEVDVQVGQEVQAGQTVGKVGQAGIATGPHLHFEVRLGENVYRTSHNPELWLAGKTADGQATGAIAGRFLDAFGSYVDMPSIIIQAMPNGAQGPAGEQISVLTYEEAALSGQPPWYESFAAGGLAPGLYRLSFPMGGLRQELVQVLPGQVTVVTFRP